MTGEEVPAPYRKFRSAVVDAGHAATPCGHANNQIQSPMEYFSLRIHTPPFWRSVSAAHVITSLELSGVKTP